MVKRYRGGLMSATQPNTTTNSGGMWNVVEQQQLLSPAGAASVAATGGASGPAITSITVTDIGFNTLDDTAVNSSNAYIKITGTGFAATSNVYIAGTQVAAANVTYTGATELRVALPVLTVGSNSVVSVFNSSGSGAIYAGNLSCSGFPTVTTSTYSASSLTISTQLLATGDGTLTYVLQGGSSLPAGLTLNSNGLITGTASGDSVTSFTVLVNDSQNQTTQQSITFTINSTDPYFKYTTLLLQADNTSNNSTNGTTVDSSTNAYTITPSGTPIQGTVNPFGTGTWSNYFDGSSRLNLPSSSAWSLGTTWTAEAWLYPKSTSAGKAVSTRVSGGDMYDLFAFYDGSWKIEGYGSNLTNGQQGSGTTYPANKWYHVAYVTNGGSTKIYVNGVLDYTYSNGFSWSASSPLSIGAAIQYSEYWNGYISNFRITNTAVYTSAFTPSTTPLTAISGTQLLTCQSNYFKDSSTNAFAITTSGTPAVDRFNPFAVGGTGYEISANTIAGSTYFNGSSQYLTVSNPGGLGSDFTLEFWMYAPSNGGGGYLFNSRTGGGGGDGIDISGQLSTTTANYVLFNSVSITADTWIHVAYVRSGSTLTRYINGTSTGSYNYAAAFTGSDFYIGGSVAGNAGYFSGYISNFRHTTTALYTSTFTPDTAPLTAVANTRLLTCQTSQSVVTDESTNKFTITTGGTPVATAKTPFTLTDTSTAGTTYDGSTYFDGSSALSLTNSGQLDVTGSFTLEGWFYYTGSGGSAVGVGGGASSWSSSNGHEWILTPNYSGTLYWQWNTSGTFSQITTTAPGAGQWHHIVVGYNGTTTRLWINGSSIGTSTSGYTLPSSRTLAKVGNNGAADTPYTGYISNLRFVKSDVYGVSNSTITPPTTPAQPIANTQFLLSGKNSAIFDATLQNNIRTVGDAKVKTSPYKYGTGSMYFDGTGDYLLSANTLTGNFGTADFTVEYWFNCGTQGTSYGTQVGTLDSSSPSGSWRFGTNIGSVAGVYFAIHDGSSYTDITFNTTNYHDNTWHHIAVSRSGTTLRAFVDGIQVGSNQSLSLNLTARRVVVGAELFTPSYYTGYLDDLRITKGYARYTANFTVPDLALKNK